VVHVFQPLYVNEVHINEEMTVMTYHCIVQDISTETGTSLIHTFPLDILSSSAELGGMLLLCTLYKLLRCLRLPCWLGSPFSLCKKGLHFKRLTTCSVILSFRQTTHQETFDNKNMGRSVLVAEQKESEMVWVNVHGSKKCGWNILEVKKQIWALNSEK
jgi:hypothetical protein